ncbi:MAG: hypothetical protein PVH62_04965 [Anaerolineae bacterium]|jgi:hypothetical protein
MSRDRPTESPRLQHLVLIPSLACPASCAYRFNPHEDGSAM